jgi:hypothetical protein
MYPISVTEDVSHDPMSRLKALVKNFENRITRKEEYRTKLMSVFNAKNAVTMMESKRHPG